jgi:hypothetical protein
LKVTVVTPLRAVPVIFTVLPARARFFVAHERRQLTVLILGVATYVTPPPPPLPGVCAAAADAVPSAASTSAHALRIAKQRLVRKIPLASLLGCGLRG